MKFVISNNDLWDQILYRSFRPAKKRRQSNILAKIHDCCQKIVVVNVIYNARLSKKIGQSWEFHGWIRQKLE